ncbi:hypothetical protein MKW92_049523, partial [Papaver armeniacum]
MACNDSGDDQKGKRKLHEVEGEPRIHWYPREFSITRFPYGIPFPQGCESPEYEADFSWYLEDLQHNVEVKLEQDLQKDRPLGAISHELLMDSQVDRLRRHFNQPNPASIGQDTSNPFADLYANIGFGSSAQHAAEGMNQGALTKHGDRNECYATGMPKSATHPQMGKNEHWVLYAFHLKYGPFEVHEGVAVVADRFLISGVSRIGYQSITLDARERRIVRHLAGQPLHRDEPIRFPVMDSLCLATGRIGRAIFEGFGSPGTQPATNP